MPRVPIKTIHLFGGHKIPQDDAHQFICLYCGYSAKRSRAKWIQHVNDDHPIEFQSILDGIRAVNHAIQQINDSDNQMLTKSKEKNLQIGFEQTFEKSKQKGVTQLVMLNEGTMDHVRCIKEVFPVALKYSNKIFGNDWALQYDGAWSHTHHLTKQWCQDHFLAFIDKNHWPPNNPDLNPLNYCIWDELVEAIN